MNILIVHLSDIHYRQGWEENHDVTFREFFKDLMVNIDQLNPLDIYLVISGDIVQSGHDRDSYSGFLSKFDEQLNKCGIKKSNRISVPGNHDVSTSDIKSKFVDHEGVVSQGLGEIEVNDYFNSPSDVFRSKFTLYKEFEDQFACYGGLSSKLTGTGWDIDDNIGIYCLNSALFSRGGLEGKAGSNSSDKERLVIATRDLYSWAQASRSSHKILVMHHPISWLAPWAQKELRVILNKYFSLYLSGHSHDQSTHHSISKGTFLIEVSAPPLFTNKSDNLGYSLVKINTLRGVTDITYRQWTKYYTFVPGVNFSNSEDGKVYVDANDNNSSLCCPVEISDYEALDLYLSDQLNKALISFSSQPKVWVEPTLSRKDESKRWTEPLEKVSVEELISAPNSTIIKAPPQFGLTCLARHLALEAWRATSPSFWLYLDSKQMKQSINNINQAAEEELGRAGRRLEDVKCVIIDSWSTEKKGALTFLKNACTLFKDIPVIVMQTIDNSLLVASTDDENIGREFQVLFLCALSRENIRKVVTCYNDERPIGDEDSITKKVVSDLDVLNIHRTPLNCITLLKVSEVDFDESPVNRTDMLKKVLFILFNMEGIPSYKTKPDLKDCEYVLGYFCETMLREEKYSFTREYFMDTLRRFCKERFMDIEVDLVFDVLYSNNILVNYGNLFCFRFAYWIFYFAAQRMHHDEAFATFIFSDMRYARYPEVIEFYTGTDRRRADALGFLIDDLKNSLEKVQEKCGLPDELNPYQFLQWKPSPEVLEQMETEVRDGVQASNLPTIIKDQYADRTYDRTRPYYQEVRNILREHSLVYLMQSIRAAARALRNSDYVDPNVKQELLIEILKSWKQLSKILLVLMPLLAERGHATFEGALFILAGKFGKTPEERMWSLLSEIPNNIVRWYEEDLFSQKMGPLLIDQVSKENDAIKKHELILLLIMHRPRDWKETVIQYISSSAKNSFYLFDIDRILRNEYCYSFASPSTLKELGYLIKMVAVKHSYGSKSPGPKAITKMSDSVLPSRIF